jgi:RNA polymerase sigma-70 factor (ECF subfamily)
MSFPPDAELLRRLRHDPEALGELYRRHVDRVIGFASRRCRQPADVADLVGATFLAAIESSGTFDPERGEVLPWLLGIAGRLHANQSRRRVRERRANERVGRVTLRVELHDDDVRRLEARIDAERRAVALIDGLDRLPERHREVLLLVGADGLRPEQAAQVLGIEPAAFRMRLTRARRALGATLTSSPTPRPAH